MRQQGQGAHWIRGTSTVVSMAMVCWDTTVGLPSAFIHDELPEPEPMPKVELGPKSTWVISTCGLAGLSTSSAPPLAFLRTYSVRTWSQRSISSRDSTGALPADCEQGPLVS